MTYDRRSPQLVDVQDWSQWPYVAQAGRPNIAQHWPWGYPTIGQTAAYRVYGPPPRPRKVNHLMHFVIMVFTGGIWLPAWIGITIATHVGNTRADADYWSKIQRYWQWELAQANAVIPPPRELPQGG